VADLSALVDSVAAESRFSGAVRVDRGAEVVLDTAYGLANRAFEIPNRPDTQFGVASGLKGLTALVTMTLVDEGVLGLDTPVRAFLGDDLPLIADDVTVEHLLAHRSGIGDYIDEDAGGEVTEYVLLRPVHELVGPEDFVPVLDGYPTKFAAGTSFSYCNGGFVVLAIVSERASGIPYHELVIDRVCTPAGMTDSAFLRSDELPARAATGYLFVDSPRTNVLHLPVRGVGDGGIYTTTADMRAFWTALVAGAIVSRAWVAEMTRPRSDASERSQYGLGFWLRTGTSVVELEGYDAGVSFRSLHDPATDTTVTVIANWTDGAWTLAKALEERVLGLS
jgi:CubicO group peptidase (beta-lactamase class C family)